ncbi:hypothetical protein ACFOD4_04395 [Pseudoroseomonas globiformis]|uniref:Uncharacterized protein n=1 Tax=Teichococcus globiformis TaxID=2307229 RepID=A0ABV7FV88_9PROT
MPEDWTTIDDPADLRLGAVMPAWFAGRMMADEWVFALLLSGGQTVLIRRIDAVHVSPAGTVLLDVDLLEGDEVPRFLRRDALSQPVLAAPTGRVRATVNLAHLAMAYEVAEGG